MSENQNTNTVKTEATEVPNPPTRFQKFISSPITKQAAITVALVGTGVGLAFLGRKVVETVAEEAEIEIEIPVLTEA